MKVRKILLDTLIIIVITLLFLAIIELVLRVTFPELKNYRKTPAHALAYEFNKDYLVALKPNVVKEFRIRKGEPDFGKVVTWKTNSLGFRGPEIGEKKGLRVIIYGDSNVQARFSDYQDTYPAVLQKLLRKKIKYAEVINAGLIGAGPDQSFLRLKHDFNAVKPDLVILHIFADNDYGDIIKNRLFKLSDTGTLVRTGLPATVDKKLPSLKRNIVYALRHLYLQGAIYYVATKIADIKQSKLSNEQKVTKKMEILEDRASRSYQVYIKDKRRQFSHFGDNYDIDVATDPDSESARIKIAIMDEIILSAKRFCDEKRVNFLLVVQPSMTDLTSIPGRIGYRNLTKRYKKYKPSNLTDPLKQLCSTQSLNCVHLIDSYRQNSPEDFYRNDGHWNTKGQQLAAKETEKEIEKLLVPPTLN